MPAFRVALGGGAGAPEIGFEAILGESVAGIIQRAQADLRLCCDLAAYPGAERDDPRALESFKVGGHHRITRRALVEWLARNRNARRAGDNSG